MKVSFKNLRLGSIYFKVEDYDFKIEDYSYSYPYNSLGTFVYELYYLATVKFLETKIVFYAEPSAYEFFFHKKDNNITLKIFYSKNYTSTGFMNTLIYEKLGTFRQICLPFWRALRELQTHYTKDEFENRWEENFSYKELDNLSKIIKDKEVK